MITIFKLCSMLNRAKNVLGMLASNIRQNNLKNVFCLPHSPVVLLRIRPSAEYEQNATKSMQSCSTYH